MIEHLTSIILNCMTNPPTPEAGARLAAYRVTDELRKAMAESDAAARRLARGSLFPAEYDRDDDYRRHVDTLASGIVAAAWDVVLEDGGDA